MFYVLKAVIYRSLNSTCFCVYLRLYLFVSMHIIGVEILRTLRPSRQSSDVRNQRFVQFATALSPCRAGVARRRGEQVDIGSAVRVYWPMSRVWIGAGYCDGASLWRRFLVTHHMSWQVHHSNFEELGCLAHNCEELRSRATRLARLAAQATGNSASADFVTMQYLQDPVPDFTLPHAGGEAPYGLVNTHDQNVEVENRGVPGEGAKHDASIVQTGTLFLDQVPELLTSRMDKACWPRLLFSSSCRCVFDSIFVCLTFINS